ncbi:alpha/beta hydrolase fold family protein [Lysobacter antibioticus]|uniref:Alpha/beta hydrolase fold family protein n=1 Tax=Lysobacter antibioticus TaxID=84531 RepID=A0A0S2F451_LYSAN|nr:alpha/beta fold hydrolase [Lysobacter antibioticus]ALN62115.1 alpha/beta hydrolase fold family protein [Lysobacter antibioticus]ALN78299.1 alpha/beta hydrolase fold family protein [Lysobacter antibioticus]
MTALQEFAVDSVFGRLAGLRNGQVGAPRLLALHGWLDNAASFVPIAPWFEGFDLVAPDLPGHGASAHLPPAADYTLITAARAALAVADALGWDRFHVLGHSLGGATASVVAAATPQRVDRLLLIEALGSLAEPEDRVAARLREAFAGQAALLGKQLRVFGDIATAVRARMTANSLSEPVARLLVERGVAPVRSDESQGGFIWRSDPRLTLTTAMRMSEAQMRSLIAAIESPTCMVWADPAQPYMPDALRRERATLLPRGEMHVLAGTHHLHMEQPRDVGELFRAFLAG